MTRTLLMLSYTFPPDNKAAAVRPGQLFEYLPMHNIRPFVVASSAEGSSSVGAFVHRVPDGGERATVVLISRATHTFVRFCAPYNDRLPWAPYATYAAAALLRTQSIDAIYSTSPFLVSHIVALGLKRKFGLPWIADFQDPWRDNPDRSRHWVYPYDALLEGLVFRNADRLIANTDTVAAAWRTRYPRWGSKISVLWNSYDPREKFVPRGPPMRPYKIIAHVGSLYGGRHPAQLLSALERMGTDPSILRVKLVGPINRAILSEHSVLFERLRLRGVLDFNNQLVPRQQAMDEIAESDSLLLLNQNDRNVALQVPSKLLDYIRAGKPILAYTPKDSPVERILVKSGIPFVAIDPTAPNDLHEKKLHEFFQFVPRRYEPSGWFEETFSAAKQAETFAAIMDSMFDSEETARHRGYGWGGN